MSKKQQLSESDFKSLMSEIRHEIASPLTVIKQINKKLSFHNDSEVIESKREVIANNLEKIESVIKNYLDPHIDFQNYTYISEEDSNYELIDVNTIIMDTVSNFKYLLNDAEISLEVFKSREVDNIRALVNKTRLYQAIYNLIKNSYFHLKQLDQDFKKIKLSFSSKRDKFMISIEDNGEGFSEEQKNLIFNENISQNGKEHGLGLQLVKKYVEQNKGQVKLDKSYTDGARFDIEIPVNKVVNTSVLIVDDLQGILDTLEYVLGDNYNINICTDAKQALNLYIENNFDIIISDVMMPGVTGVDFYYQVKELGFKGRFIFFTAFQSDEIDEILKNDPNVSLVNKPELSELEDAVHDASQRRAA